jgi:hypothetical protein
MNEIEAIARWLDVAKSLRASCRNLDVFDVRIAEQDVRLKAMVSAQLKAIRNEHDDLAVRSRPA